MKRPTLIIIYLILVFSFVFVLCVGVGVCGGRGQSEGLTERINEPPWGRCLQGAVDVRWVVVVVLLCCRRRPESPLAEL